MTNMTEPDTAHGNAKKFPRHPRNMTLTERDANRLAVVEKIAGDRGIAVVLLLDLFDSVAGERGMTAEKLALELAGDSAHVDRSWSNLEGAKPALLAVRLKSLREQRGLAQVDLARKVDLKTWALCHYEHGRRMPPRDKLVELASALGTSPEYLMGMTDRTDPAPKKSKAGKINRETMDVHQKARWDDAVRARRSAGRSTIHRRD